MKLLFFFLLLAVSSIDGILIPVVLPVTTLGTAIAAALALKIAASVGYAVGSNLGRRQQQQQQHHQYGRRSVENDDVGDIMRSASLEDDLDCAKRIICSISAKRDPRMLSEEELSIRQLFENGDDFGEFSKAAKVGKIGGEKRCGKIYNRCPLQEQILAIQVKQSFYQNLR